MSQVAANPRNGKRFRWFRGLEAWIDDDTVLDSWFDPRWQRLIALHALAEPLRGHGYVAVCRHRRSGVVRSVVFLREETVLRSLDPGTETAELRRHARAVRRRTNRSRR